MVLAFGPEEGGLPGGCGAAAGSIETILSARMGATVVVRIVESGHGRPGAAPEGRSDDRRRRSGPTGCGELRRKDPTLDAAADALDLELVDEGWILRPGVTLDDGWTLADSSNESPPQRGRVDRTRTARDAELAASARSRRRAGWRIWCRCEVDGHRALRRLVIAPELFEGRDPDLLADLIMSAIAEAQRRVDALADEARPDPTGPATVIA